MDMFACPILHFKDISTIHCLGFGLIVLVLLKIKRAKVLPAATRAAVCEAATAAFFALQLQYENVLTRPPVAIPSYHHRT